MSRVVSFDMLQKREQLLEDLDILQEEIDILNLILKKARSEYLAIDNEIKKTQQSEQSERVKMSVIR